MTQIITICVMESTDIRQLITCFSSILISSWSSATRLSAMANISRVFCPDLSQRRILKISMNQLRPFEQALAKDLFPARAACEASRERTGGGGLAQVSPVTPSVDLPNISSLRELRRLWSDVNSHLLRYPNRIKIPARASCHATVQTKHTT